MIQDMQKCCILCDLVFDEMAIRKHAQWSTKTYVFLHLIFLSLKISDILDILTNDMISI